MNIGFRILQRPHKPPMELVDQFRNVVTPYISDNMNRLYGAPAAIRPYHGSVQLLGVALTVKTRPGDNLMVHKAIDLAGPGDVIVVDAGGEVAQAIIGEIMLSLAEKRGIAGFVIDGAIRDSSAFERRQFPVFARGVTHRGPYKEGPGEINVPVAIAGMVVHPGDIMVGDVDGVIAVPWQLAGELITKVGEQHAREVATLQAIDGGMADRRWVDETLMQKGCDLSDGTRHSI